MGFGSTMPFMTAIENSHHSTHLPPTEPHTVTEPTPPTNPAKPQRYFQEPKEYSVILGTGKDASSELNPKINCANNHK
jgi:hypothetical protein